MRVCDKSLNPRQKIIYYKAFFQRFILRNLCDDDMARHVKHTSNNAKVGRRTFLSFKIKGIKQLFYRMQNTI